MTTITERPHAFSFSENEIRYVFATDDPAAAGCTVEVELHYVPADESADVKMITLSLTPEADGSIYLQIKSYLKSLLTPQMPDPAGALLQPVTEQTKLFYIRYREITNAAPDPDWIDDVANYFTILLGGVEQVQFRRNNFFANYMATDPKFLTWQPTGKRVFTEQEHYLTFLILSADITAFTVSVQTVFTDLSENITSSVTEVTGDYFRLWRMKAGVTALGLHLINPSKKIYYYEISVTSAAGTIAMPYRFYVDYNTFYDYHDFNYINSLGGLDSVRLVGEFNWNVSVTSDDLEHISNRENFTSAFPQSQFSQANMIKRDTYKGDIGWSKNQLQQETLIELPVSKAIFENINGRWIRILNLTRSQDLRSNKDKKWSFPLEWNYGFADSVFTPKNVQLGAGIPYVPPVVIVVPPECIAVALPAYNMPNGAEGTPYSFSVTATGTAPFTISDIVKPAWMNVNLAGADINVTGTPDSGNEVNLSFTLHNCTADTVNFVGSFSVQALEQPGTEGYFGDTEFISGDANQETERRQLVGIAGSVITLTLTTRTINGSGNFTVEGSSMYLNQTINYTLDSGGHAWVNIHITGNPAENNAIVFGKLTITAVSAGTIGSQADYQFSKVF